MSSVVCTLFEGNYHYGVAMLVNSLYVNGFRGTMYIGYRSELTNWCSEATDDLDLQWPGGRTLKINNILNLHFLPINTNYHLAHTKPDFMRRVWEGPAKGATSISYFDPDIVIKCNWAFFEKWMNHGVALVHEIVMNDMPSSHPVRKEWENIIINAGKKVERQLTSYLNCGFCGVSKENIHFVYLWAEMISIAVNQYNQNPAQFATYDRNSAFWSIDQDTFNMAAMCSQSPISEVGPEGMDFVYGGQIMSHAAGAIKPWNKKYIRSALGGNPPSLADREFWKYSTGPISNYNNYQLKIKKVSMQIAGFIGRFYKRS